MLLWIATLVLTAAMGFSIALTIDKGPAFHIAYAFPIGLLLSSWLFFALLFYIGFSYAYAIFAAISLASIAFVARNGAWKKVYPALRKASIRLSRSIVGFFRMKEIQGDKDDFYRKLVAYAIIASVFAFVVIYFMFSVRFDSYGNVLAYGGAVTDLPWHLGIADHFAYSTPATVLNFPYFYGAKFFYPFMADYYLSVLIRSGMNPVSSAIVVNTILAALMVALLYFFVYRISKDRLVAAAASFIFLLFSSQILSYLPGALGSICKSNQLTFAFGAGIIEMILSPQRDMLTALVLALVALLLLVKSDFNKRHALFLGVIVGLMPLLQGEMFIILNILMLYMLLRKRFVEYGLFLIVMLALSLPQVLFIASQESVHSFLYPVINNDIFYCGYGPAHAASQTAGVLYSLANRLVFWFESYGFLLPFAAYGAYVLLRENKSRKGRGAKRNGSYGEEHDTRRMLLLVGVPFLALFLVLNLFSLQPSFADNNKASMMFALYLAILAAYPLKHARGKRFLLVFLMLALICGQNIYFLYGQAAGSFGSYNSAGYHGGQPTGPILFSPLDFKIAGMILNDTPAGSVMMSMPSWLGSPEASGVSLRNPIAALTGRQMVTAMGTYVGGIGIPFNNLVNTSDEELAIYKYWNCSLINKYNVSYIYVGYYESNLTSEAAPFPKVFNLNSAGQNFTLYNTTSCRDQ